MASKGFCILAQGDDHIEMARIAAKSIRLTQLKNAGVCIITNDELSDEQKEHFDYVVNIPWMDHAENSNHKIENTWKYFWATPFDETIVISPDMVVPSDLSHWWELLREKDLWLPCHIHNFAGNCLSKQNLYLDNSHIQQVYANLFYFKQSDLSAEFFCMLEQVFNNWEMMYGRHLGDTRPTKNDMSLNYALSAYLLGIMDQVCEPSVYEIPTFVNIYDGDTNDEIFNPLNVFINKENEFHISNYKQYLPIHYDNKNWFDKYRIAKLYDKKK